MSCRWDYLGKTKRCRKWGTRVPLRQRRTRNTKNKNKSNRKFGIQDKMTTEARFYQRWPNLNPQSQSFYVCLNTTANIWKWKRRFLGHVRRTPPNSTHLFQCWVSFAGLVHRSVSVGKTFSDLQFSESFHPHPDPPRILLWTYVIFSAFLSLPAPARSLNPALKSVDWHVNKHVRDFKRLDLRI